jgi:putative transposase
MKHFPLTGASTNVSTPYLDIHLVLVTKYRRKVITADVLRRLNEIFEATCTKWRCTLKQFNGETDHVHLVISFPPDVQVSTLVGNLKTVSSRLIRKEFSDWISKFYKKPLKPLPTALRSHSGDSSEPYI